QSFIVISLSSWRAGNEFKQRDYDARGTRLQPFAISSGMRILRVDSRARRPCHVSKLNQYRYHRSRKQMSLSAKQKRRAEALPLVAIIGRPNVGKSTLFNRLIGERRAIVGDEPGITRDRIYGEANWRTQRFALVDTGGIVPDDEAVIPANILKQASFAIDDAQALIWVVDARKGITPLDEELARLLRSTGKRVLTAANKADATHWESDAGEFHRFGFAEVFPISAEHGNGIGEMLDALVGDGSWQL